MSRITEAITRARPRILILDDDEDVLFFLTSLLKSEYDVIALSTGVDIETVVEKERPNVLLLDYMMPTRNGIDVCKALRLNPENDFMPIVFLSGAGAEAATIKAYEAGADDFLNKPIDHQELRAKLDVWTRLARRSAELNRQRRHFKELALRDGLTGLFSRRHGLEQLDLELARFSRYHTPLSVLLIDVDAFKQINDVYGHQAGDEALKAVANFITTQLRESDICCRYGGDEFLIILPSTSLEEAGQVCRKLTTLPIRCHLRDDVETTLKLSIGGASAQGVHPSTSQLIDQADVAMLSAKNSPNNGYRLVSHEHDVTNMLDGINEKRTSAREAICTMLATYLLPDMKTAKEVRDLALRLATRAELNEAQRATISNAAGLALVEAINPTEAERPLAPENKADRLTLREILYRSLSPLRLGHILDSEADLLLDLHERPDGQGLPDGLSGDAVPLPAQLLALSIAYIKQRSTTSASEALKVISRDAQSRFRTDAIELLKKELA